MKSKIGVLMLGVLLYAEGLAQAVPITIEISGTVTSASGSALPATIYRDVTFIGSYTYDSSTINTGVFGNRGRYVHNSPYGIEILLGGFEFTTVVNHVGQFEVEITNSGSNWDWYKIISNENLSVDGTAIESITWTLGGPGSTISSFALPVSEPAVIAELTDWASNVLEISGQNLLIQGTVTQVVLIPEPAISTLLLAGMFLLRRRL